MDIQTRILSARLAEKIRKNPTIAQDLRIEVKGYNFEEKERSDKASEIEEVYKDIIVGD